MDFKIRVIDKQWTEVKVTVNDVEYNLGFLDKDDRLTLAFELENTADELSFD